MALSIAKTSGINMSGWTADEYIITGTANNDDLDDLYDIIVGHADFSGDTDGSSGNYRVKNVYYNSTTPGIITVAATITDTRVGHTVWNFGTRATVNIQVDGAISNSTSLVLDSTDNLASSGFITINGARYDYTANNTSTDTLTLATAATIADDATGTGSALNAGRVWFNLLSGSEKTIPIQVNGALNNGTALVLDDTGGLPDTGTVTISGTDYNYNANNKSSNTLTLITAATIADNATGTGPDARSQITLGAEQFNTVTGTIDINYSIIPVGGTCQPWDNWARDNTDNRRNHYRYAILCGTYGNLTTPLSDNPFVTINFNYTQGSIRFDPDIGPYPQTGQVTIAANFWDQSSNSFLHNGASRITLGTGTQFFYDRSGKAMESRPVIQTSTSSLTGDTIHEWPAVWITDTQNTTKYNVLYPGLRDGNGNPTGGGGDDTGSNRFYVIPDYPFDEYRTIALNSAAGGSGGNPVNTWLAAVFLDPQTTTPTSFSTVSGNTSNTTAGIHLFQSSYNVSFQSVAGASQADGYVIRRRNADNPSIPTNGTFNGNDATFLANPRNYVNFDMEHYGWQINSSSGKSGYTLTWGIRHNRPQTAFNSPTQLDPVYYGGSNNSQTYTTYLGGPGRLAQAQTRDPLPASGVADRSVDISITADTIPGWTSANETAGRCQVIRVLTNPTITSTTNLETFTFGNTVLNVDQVASGLIDIPHRLCVDWSALTNANKHVNANESAYNTAWESIHEFEGNIISVSGDVLTVKNKDASTDTTLAYGSGFIPTKGTTYDTIHCEGIHDLNGQALDCTSTGSNHAELTGDMREVLTYSSFPTSSQYSIRGHRNLNGTIDVPFPTNSGDITYIKFEDCASPDGFTVNASGNGAGSVFVIGATNATFTSSRSGNTGINEVNILNLTLSKLAAEGITAINASGGYSSGTTLTVDSTADFPDATTTYPQTAYARNANATGTWDTFTYTGKTATTLTGVSGLTAKTDNAIVRTGLGRLTVYNGTTLVKSWTADDGDISASGSTITLTTNSVDSSNLGEFTGGIIVWTGPGGRDVRQSLTTGTGTTNTTVTRVESDVSTAISDGGTNITYTPATWSSGDFVTRITGGAVPSIPQLWWIVDNVLRPDANYHLFINNSADHLNALSNNGDSASADGRHVKFEAGEASNKVMPYIQNDIADNLKAANPLTQDATFSSTDYSTSIVGTAPVISEALFRDLGVALQTDVDNSITTARNVLIGTINSL